MSIVFSLLLLVIFAAVVAFSFSEGLWSNAIRFINVVTAALLATNFWEPVAKLLDDNVSSSFTYFWDFLSLWVLFAVFMLVLRLATGAVSKVKVRFMLIVDRIGSAVLAMAAAWIIVCFTLFSLHTAPLAKNFMGGAFDYQQTMFLVGPDRQWVSFVGWVSRGAYSRTMGDGEIGQKLYGEDPTEPESERRLAVFGRWRTFPQEFMSKYAARRSAMETVAAGGTVQASGAPKR